MEMCGEAHRNMEPKVIDGVDFLSPQRRKQSAGSAGKSILTVQTLFWDGVFKKKQQKNIAAQMRE